MLPALWHRYIFLIGLIGLAAGMLFGTVPTSIPQIILAANWLLEKDFTIKWQRLKTNRIFWLLISLYVLHLVGMIYTENIQRGLDDLRNKMPLAVLPLILFSTKPLTAKEFKWLFGFFFLSVFVSSVCCFFVYMGFTKKVIIDIRQVSVFMSHIRFSLFIAFAVIGLIHFCLTDRSKPLIAVSLLLIPWFIFVMYKFEMATGFFCLLCVGPVLLLVYLYRTFHKAISIVVLSVILIIAAWFVKQAYNSLGMFDKDPKLYSNYIKEKTVSGYYYLQDTLYKMAENGTLITINVNDPELKKEWEERSAIPYYEFDKRGNGMRFTILRYLASKKLTKDSAGLSLVSDTEIKYMEDGISNYKYVHANGLKSRWRELVWEFTKYKAGENPSGHTLTMRVEFWKTACYIIQQHALFGVGTGDIQDAFNAMYIEKNSKLDPVWRLRCHNQYLAITVAFGIFGFIIFMIYLFYPAIVLRKKLSYLYQPFFLIALLSFITEDTLETQSGVTFFIFFNALFLWLASSKKDEDIRKENSLTNNP